MKKQITKRAISLLTALALVLGTVFATTGQVEAASKAPAKMVVETLWVGDWSSANVEFDNWKNYDKAKLLSIKSSNKKVIKVKKYGSKMYDQSFEMKKPGKSKITIVYKLNGKKYTMKATYTVKKYPKPLKSVAVNEKKISLNKNKYQYYKENYKKTTAKVKVQPAAGWKIQHVYADTYNGKKFKEIKVSKKAIQNGKTFKFPKKDKELYVGVTLVNKKGETLHYSTVLVR